MDYITKKVNPQHLYSLYVTGVTPVTLIPNTYNNVVQTDASTVSITLPPADNLIDGTYITFNATNGGTINILADGTDTIEGDSSISTTDCITLTVNPANTNWFINSPLSAYPIPSSSDSQSVFVNKGGLDLEGHGTTFDKAFLTIGYAMDSIVDASTTKRYVIYIGSGTFTETVTCKNWVFIEGSGNNSTRIAGNVNIDDPSWAVPGSTNDQRAGIQEVTVTGSVSLDFDTNLSDYGKFYFNNCNVNTGLTITGRTAINQVTIFDGNWFGGITGTGVNLTLRAVVVYTGNVTINPSAINTSVTTIGSGIIGNLVLNSNGNTGVIASQLYGCYVSGTVTINGANTTLSTISSNLPVQSSISILNGATLTRLNDPYALLYTSPNPAFWATAPTSLQNAVDRIASAVYALRGNVAIP